MKVSFFIKTALIAILCSLSVSAFCAEEHKYDIIKGKDNLGTLSAKKYEYGGTVKYMLFSSIEFWFLGDQKVIYLLNNTFEDGRLIKAESKSMLNGKTRHSNSIVWKNNKYIITKDGKDQKNDIEFIDYTFAAMYFNEPSADRETVFSERYLEYSPIKKQDNGQYCVTLPSGKQNCCEYEGGIIKNWFINHSLAKFSFNLQTE